MIASTARSASAFVEPIVVATRSTKSILFAIQIFDYYWLKVHIRPHLTILSRILGLSIEETALSTALWNKKTGGRLPPVSLLTQYFDTRLWKRMGDIAPGERYNLARIRFRFRIGGASGEP